MSFLERHDLPRVVGMTAQEAPTMYSQETRDAVVDALAGESLNRICRREGFPDRRTVERWMDDDPEFAAKCARAREAHAERLFDGMEDIEDGVLDGSIKADAAKVVLSSRQWRAEKLKPKKFGAKLDLAHSGSVKFERIECVVVDTAR